MHMHAHAFYLAQLPLRCSKATLEVQVTATCHINAHACMHIHACIPMPMYMHMQHMYAHTYIHTCIHILCVCDAIGDGLIGGTGDHGRHSSCARHLGCSAIALP